MGLIPVKTELLYGQVFKKMAKSPTHTFYQMELLNRVRPALPLDTHVRQDQPITCADSEPEPDLSVVRGAMEDYRLEHPHTAEQVIEVCVASHDYDRSKLRAYAGAGVKEVWLVLVPEKQIEAHRLPVGNRFRESLLYGPGGRLASAALPGLEVDLDGLFAK
jgi:Uma2 family endonuclease